MAALPQWLVDFLKGLGKAREVNGREGVEERLGGRAREENGRAGLEERMGGRGWRREWERGAGEENGREGWRGACGREGLREEMGWAGREEAGGLWGGRIDSHLLATATCRLDCYGK